MSQRVKDGRGQGVEDDDEIQKYQSLTGSVF